MYRLTKKQRGSIDGTVMCNKTKTKLTAMSVLYVCLVLAGVFVISTCASKKEFDYWHSVEEQTYENEDTHHDHVDSGKTDGGQSDGGESDGDQSARQDLQQWQKD